MKTNVLYYGDNLDILRHHIPDNSIDLICPSFPFRQVSPVGRDALWASSN